MIIFVPFIERQDINIYRNIKSIDFSKSIIKSTNTMVYKMILLSHQHTEAVYEEAHRALAGRLRMMTKPQLDVEPGEKEPPELSVPAVHEGLPAMVEAHVDPATDIDNASARWQFEVKLK